MFRIPNFKCLLLLLIILVIGLTLGFISKFTSSRKFQEGKYTDAGVGFNYYQSVYEEEEDHGAEVSLDSVAAQNAPDNGKQEALKTLKNSKDQDQDPKRRERLDYPFEEEDKERLKSIVCDVQNGKYKISCKKDSESEVYIPFSFIQKYFEIHGKIENGQFIWLHSLAKIFRPTVPYNPKGIFTSFENYNVEVRDRVKCINGAEGVPVSTQWDINGYFYPIQIAQFGLSHFSKFLTEGEPKRVVLEDGDETRGEWRPFEAVTTLPNDNNDALANHFVQISLPPDGSHHAVALTVDVKQQRMLMLSWQIRIISEDLKPNVTFTAKVRYESHVFYLNYVTSDIIIYAKDNQIYHGLSYKSTKTFHHIIRDLSVDLQKGINFMSQKIKKSKIKKILKSKLQLESISVESGGAAALILLDNLTLSNNEHLAQFYQAADWFVVHQDGKGGWPIPVRRKFGQDFYPVLEPGWYSAMAQGHALSILSRAYTSTLNNTIYADACTKAIATIFDHPGTEAGVRADFLHKHVWYEEYPTTPSSFVLNGFMYALLGLYDVKSLDISGTSEKAKELYDTGLISLKTLLPLYDTGSGSFYDLRHMTVPGISPNLARLDYHVTHINQLLTFATFESDPIFKTVAERWIGYTEGNRASHN